MRVLILEDDCDLRLLLKEAIENMGAKVAALESPVDALDSTDPRGPFDLVLTDNQMPGATGMQFTKVLRIAGIDVPILMLSSDQGDLKYRFFEAGGTEFFEKGDVAHALGWIEAFKHTWSL